MLAGLLLPPATIAAALRAGTPIPHGLVTGIWLLKVLLVGHGVAALLLRRRLAAPSPREHGAQHSLTALAALLVAGVALRLPGLDSGLWYDEIQTLVDYVRQPWGLLLTTFDSTNQHLLFSVAAHATTSLLGESAATLRLPAMLAGVASLWAAVWFGRRWMRPREAWWSAIILALSYHHIWFSQNARGYTGLLLGTLIGTGLFLDLLRGKPATAGRVWGYAVVMALTIATHVTALAVVAGHGVAWLIRARRLAPGGARWLPFTALLLAGTVALACYAPVIPQLLGALGGSGTGAPGVAWQRPSWFIAEAVAGLIRGVPLGVVIVPVAGLVVAVGVVDTLRRDTDAMLVMVLPLVVMAVLLAITGHNLWPRFFFFGAGFAVQWAIRGGYVILDRIMPRLGGRVGDVGLGVVALGSLLLLPRAWAPKQDYPAAAAWVTDRAAAGDATIATEMLDLPLNRWLGLRWPVVTTAEQLAAHEAASATTWVLYTFPIRLQATTPRLWERLQSSYAVAHVVPASVGGGEVVIMRRDPPP